jgi:hypothetical protein
MGSSDVPVIRSLRLSPHQSTIAFLLILPYPMVLSRSGRPHVIQTPLAPVQSPRNELKVSSMIIPTRLTYSFVRDTDTIARVFHTKPDWSDASGGRRL